MAMHDHRDQLGRGELPAASRSNGRECMTWTWSCEAQSLTSLAQLQSHRLDEPCALLMTTYIVAMQCKVANRLPTSTKTMCRLRCRSQHAQARACCRLSLSEHTSHPPIVVDAHSSVTARISRR